jgi:hypothetical protein
VTRRYEAVRDNRVRLATEEELRRLRRLRARHAAHWQAAWRGGVGRPGGAGHETAAFAAGSQTESVKIRTEELSEGGQATIVPLVRRSERGSEEPLQEAGAHSAGADVPDGIT